MDHRMLHSDGDDVAGKTRATHHQLLALVGKGNPGWSDSASEIVGYYFNLWVCVDESFGNSHSLTYVLTHSLKQAQKLHVNTQMHTNKGTEGQLALFSGMRRELICCEQDEVEKGMARGKD